MIDNVTVKTCNYHNYVTSFCCFNRSPSSQSRSVVSSQTMYSFTMEKMKGRRVDIMSLFKDKLLATVSGLVSRIFIYNTNGRYLSTVTVDDVLCDAIWTSAGNILYTAVNSKKAILISEAGEVITDSQLTNPQCLSIFNNTIYLADEETGVFQSTDGGATWSFVFSSITGGKFRQVVQVRNDPTDDFWVREYDNNRCSLRIYSLTKRRSAGGKSVTWKTVILPKLTHKSINLNRSRLSFDGDKTVFLSDFYNKTVHVFSANGDYNRQLISYNTNTPCRLVADREHQLLFVGQNWSVIDVFLLIYDEEAH